MLSKLAITAIPIARSKEHTLMQSQERYTSDYFDRQRTKSSAKIAWQYDRMLNFADIRPDVITRVLDVGCGAAPGLRYLQQRGIAAVGVDISPDGLLAARQLLPVAQLVRCDLEAPLPFASAQFSLALLSEIVEHIVDLPFLLGELHRVLRPGGTLVLTTPNLWDVRRLVAVLGGPTWTGDTDSTHVNLQTPRTIRRYLERAGFVHVRVRAGWKPVVRLGGRRLARQIVVPYPPLIGNGIMACGRA